MLDEKISFKYFTNVDIFVRYVYKNSKLKIAEYCIKDIQIGYSTYDDLK